MSALKQQISGRLPLLLCALALVLPCAWLAVEIVNRKD